MKLDNSELNSGDHIYVRRKGLLYSHHGIYAGEGNVIHFKGADKEKRNPEIVVTDMDNFLNFGKLRRRNYKKRLPHSETLRIAQANLTNKKYSLGFNNCEHFAAYCATGKKKSVQVRRAIASIAAITFAVTSAFIKKKQQRKRRDDLLIKQASYEKNHEYG